MSARKSKSAIGEILVGYALAENNLRAMMVHVPGHKPRSNLSADIERLKKQKAGNRSVVLSEISRCWASVG